MPIEQITERNPERAEAFANQMVGVLNNAALSLMTSIGHRTGLFDTMASMPAGTTEQIAETACLNERYVREWLGAMTTGGVVEHDPILGTYYLPPEHAASLTRDAGPDNLATPAQFISVLGSVETDIAECFRHGGGVPYERYPRFHEVMADESSQTVLCGLLDSILPLADVVPALETGIDVLDVGCGRGRAANLMARTFPNSRFVAYDFSAEAIRHAREEARRHGSTNIRFEIQDAAAFDDTASYDLITAFDAIHDQADPARVLSNIRRALRTGGVFLMQDIAGSSHHHNNLDHPMAPFMYTVSCMHCMSVSLARDGAGLGAMWGRETAERMLAEAGFDHLCVEQLEHDALNYYYVARG